MPDKREKKNGQIEFTVKNEIKLDPLTPIPIDYGCDSFYIARDKKYIPFLGKNDNLPNLLLEARLTSTTQNACITSIAQSVLGNGLMILDVEKPDEQFLAWSKVCNNDQQSLDEILCTTIDGERTHGNEFIELVKGKIGKVAYLKVYTHSMLTCRLGVEDETTGKPTQVIMSNQFARRGGIRRLKDPTVIPLYNPDALDKKSCWIVMADGTERTMLHFKNEVSGVEHYGLPASVAGLRYQVLEGKSAQYNIDNFENNMVLGGMLILKSAMTTDEADATAKKIMLSHIGSGKTGRIAVISSETGLDDVDWKPYDTQKEGSFIEFDKRVEEKIVAANQWDSMLAGLTRNSSLGTGNSYIRSIWDVKEAILLKPLRNKLIDKVLKPIIQVYSEVYSNKEILKYNFSFKSAMPFSFLGDIDPDNFMQVNEARTLAGMPVDESKKDVYLAEMKPKNKDVQNKPTTP